jgi:hypothetical protein
MNNPIETVPIQVGNPPDASEIAELVPMRGLNGVVCRSYVRRSVVGGVVLVAAILGGAAITYHDGGHEAPALQTISVADPVGVSLPAVPTGNPLPKDDTTDPTAVTSIGPEVLKVPSEILEADPVSTAVKAPNTPSGPLESELGSLDMADLVSAVDNLGIRLEGAEKKLAAAVDKPDPVSEAHIPQARSEDPMKARPLSDQDAALRTRLLERVSKAKSSGDLKTLSEAEAELSMFHKTLGTLIEFRIVDRKGAKAGFWRSPSDDPRTKQFFLVVEAVVDGKTVTWAIKDADSGRVASTETFGLNVDEKTFAEFSDDKKEDGRIDDLVVGLKPVGRITPVWNVKTSGETISGVGESR